MIVQYYLSSKLSTIMIVIVQLTIVKIRTNW